MSKELEALKYFKSAYNSFLKTTNDMFCQITISREQANEFVEEVEVVEKALLELQSIKEANPSEALECLECLYCECEDYRSNDRAKDYETIKNYILNAEKEHKALEIIKKTKNIKVSFYENGSGKHYKIEFDKTRNQTITKEEFNLLKEVLE